ncbi:MAG: HU family DNA-binding protein [Alcanivoracaceae bacterium]|nr:HU family DNA-binding protein [Alcanivoracaceae bacterium]
MAAKKKVAAKKPTKAPAKKAAPKKAAAKKVVAKKAAAKAPAAAPKKIKAIAEPMSKTGLIGHLAEATELSKKQIAAVFEELAGVIEGHLKKKGGVGQFTMPGMFKIVTKHKPAQKARKGIHPITKEPTTFKAKPASVQVKVRPLKKVKDMAQ